MPLRGLLGLSGGSAGALLSGGVKLEISTPSITSPTDGYQTSSVTITSSEFQGTGSINTHVSTDWELYDDSMTTLVQSNYNSSSLRSWDVSGLSAGTTYRARVRYKGESPEKYSEWSAFGGFSVLAIPVVAFVSNTPTSWNPTAGESRTFSVSAYDSANPGAVGYTINYQWYRNGSPQNAYTGTSFDYYRPVYYSDNGNSFFCRVTITNAMGTSNGDSNVCNVSVTRSVGCDEVQRIENINFSGAGGKPGGGTNNWADKRFDNNINGVDYTDVCGVAWDIDTFRVRARPGRCPSGYDVTLEFKIEGNGVNFSKVDKQSNSDGNWSYYSVGTGWMDVQGGNLSDFRFKIIFRAGTQYTQCSDGSQVDIQPEQDNNAMGKVSIRTRTYRYDSRP